MEKDNGLLVINRETNEIYNCSKIAEGLELLFDSNKELFYRQVELLNSCIEWNDNIYTELKNLLKILKIYGIGQEFKEQLDRVVLYSYRNKTQYLPIEKRFKELYLSNTSQKGISILCNELNKLTGGLQPGTICTIAGGPGSMKTTFAVNIAYEAVKQGKNVCYLTLEESTTQLFSKLMSRVSVDVNKKLKAIDICQHNLDENSQNILFNDILPYLTSLPGSFHMIGEKDLINYEFTELERNLKIVDKNMKSKNGDEHGIDIVIVDHIQLLKYASNVKDEYKIMNDYVSFFRKQALSFLGSDKEILVILLSQVNREGIAYARKHDGQYLMQHVAEASEVERASSYIISVYTDGMTQITKLLKLGVIKLRGSQIPLDTINIYADGEYYHVGDSEIYEQRTYSSNDIFNNMPTSDVSSISLENLFNESITSDLDTLLAEATQ